MVFYNRLYQYIMVYKFKTIVLNSHYIGSTLTPNNENYIDNYI